jgi:hypothetical protein
MKRLAEELQIAEGFLPLDLATARTGDWVSLKNFYGVEILFFGAPGSAAEPATLTIQQAQAVAGTNAKGLSITEYYVKRATTNLQGVGVFTKVTQAAGSTIALTAGTGDQATLLLIPINAADLDMAGGFDCVNVSVGDVGTGAQLGCALYLLKGARYQTPPSALID